MNLFFGSAAHKKIWNKIYKLVLALYQWKYFRERQITKLLKIFLLTSADQIKRNENLVSSCFKFSILFEMGTRIPGIDIFHQVHLHPSLKNSNSFIFDRKEKNSILF